MTDAEHKEGWQEYQMLVLSQLTDLKTEVASLRQVMQSVQIEIAILKVKAGMWGAVAGSVVVIGELLLQALMKR